MTDPDLSSLSLEELSQVEVTSVSRRGEAAGQAPASIYVITQNDIRRSGAQSLPEVLRLAPNLHVTRLNAVSHAISARGFNGFETANKLLVLIDGRSVYTPLFSGVLWESHNVMLEDVERIEVISGPAGAVWGANAVNGVINVITRTAYETQGGLASLNAATTERNAALRYGGSLAGTGAWRVYATGFQRDDSLTLTGEDAHDNWDGWQAGFRTDWSHGADAFTVHGDVYRDHTTSLLRLLGPDGELRGHNLTARWSRELAGGGALTVQAYYDEATRTSPGLEDMLETYDIQAQHSFMRRRHQVVWGGGYRVTDDAFVNTLNAAVLDPERREITLANVFAQDAIALRDDLTVTLGLKLEDSSFSGLEYMPSARLAWRASDRAMWWAAVSRAVRSPSRIERDLVFLDLIVNGTFETESLVAYEVGYRGRPLDNLSLSVSAFYNDYDDLRTNEFAEHGGFPVHVGNGLEGETWGVEAWGGYDIASWWRLKAGAGALRKSFRDKPGHTDIAGVPSIGNDPQYQAQLRSRMNFRDVEVDVGLRAVDELPDPHVPSYVEADARVGWQVTDQVELAIGGSSLLDEAHIEAPEDRQVRRNLYANLRWSF